MKEKLEKLNDYEWLLHTDAREGMNAEAKIIGSAATLETIEDEAVKQLTNVAMLPGVLSPVLAMPDAHWGYGLPMGAVSAFDSEKGIMSAGLCGFDINCGINMIRTNIRAKDAQDKMKDLVKTLFSNIPCGVGSKGKLRVTMDQLDEVLTRGVNWAVEEGYGVERDISHTEEKGCMEEADPSKVSERARRRGVPQLGTLGAGNHFLEIQKVDKIFDEKAAKEWGIREGDISIMLHCGSRGFGHEVASEYLKIHEKASVKYGIKLPDPQLVCAPINSPEGQDYFKAMKCAVNYAFTNRLIMTHWMRESFEKIFNSSWEDMDMQTVYGLAHNITKKEKHTVEGKKQDIYVTRKGATRSFPDIPVIIAGSMGTASYLLKGTETAMEKTFGSTCHGAGRALSRHGAINKYRGSEIQRQLEKEGKTVMATHPKVLAEEAPGAYKDIETVIDSVHNADISKKVARLIPMGVIKG